MNFLRRFLGGENPEQPKSSGGDEKQPKQPQTDQTPQTDKEKSPSNPATPPSGAAAPGQDPTKAEKGNKMEQWDPGQGCLVVETKIVLRPESLKTVMINLPAGEIRIIGTDQVQQPTLTTEERIFAGSEAEARSFYQKEGDSVEVSTGPGSLVVREKSQPTVVVEGSRGVQISGVSGRVVIVGSNVRGNVVNTGPGGVVFINGQRVEPSQGAPRRETRVVLQVPIAENGNERETPKPSYILETGSGNITVENVEGKYTISAGAGNVEIKRCNVADSSIQNGSGDIKVTGTTLNSSGIKTGSGDIKVTGTTLNSSRIKTRSGDIKVTETLFTRVNIIETQAGDIRVRFAPGQGEIQVQTSELGNTRTQLFFQGIQNPNSQETSTLILTTQAGDITVN